MKNFRSLVEDASDALQLPLDKVPLLCTENKLSLTQRFSEFIKKFPECESDLEAVFQEIIETSQRISAKNG